MLARKLLLDLTPYFQTSTLLKIDDLMPANNYYKAESPLKIGTGKIYGMVKDFSPDFTIYAYDKLFEDAGVTPPDDTKSLSYAEVMELSKKVSKYEGDRTLVFGYGYEGGWIDRIWMNMLAEKNMNLYAEGYEKMLLTSNEEAKAVAKWYYDMADQKLTPSPLNPSPNGWFGTDFTAGQLAMCQYGFWYSAMAESDTNRGKIRMLPGPNWAGAPRDVTMTATGMIATSATQIPDATWKVFEYYNGGQPAIDRAKSGWGVPGLKSQLELIPQTTDFQKQANKVLQAELAQTVAPLQFNPFIGESDVSNSWSKNLDIALRGEIDFDTVLANIEAEINQSIKDGITAIMG
jgi:multiple sugar transport system substrate-binding protein